MEKSNISYSAMTKFCNCRKAYKFSNIDRIEPVKKADSLSFGKLIHSCLEAHYNGDPYNDIINENYPVETHYNALAFAMMAGYENKYRDIDADIKVLETEMPFECDIVNPLTGRKSRKFRLYGYIDMVVKIDGEIWIHEHKTASSITDGDIERLWHKSQHLIYAMAYQRMTGKKVAGVVYNMLQKAKNKQGKKETFSDFAERLKARYLAEPQLFHREPILIDDSRIHEIENEIWQITQDMGKCKNYYKNRSQCYGFGECAFFKICNSGDNPLIIQNYYKERENVTDTENEETHESF